MNRDQLKQLANTLVADRNKIVAVLALVVGLLLWGRLLLKQVPRTAIADQPAKVANSSQGTSDNFRAVFKQYPKAFVGFPNEGVRNNFSLESSVYDKFRYELENNELGKLHSNNAEIIEDTDGPQFRQEELMLDSLAGQSVVVNGQAVKLGQRIGGWKLIWIGHRHAVLQRKGKQVELKM